MQYLLLIYGAEGAWESRSEDERQAMHQEYGALERPARAGAS